MFNWFKNLIDAYDKMFVIEKPKQPTVYKIGNRRYIRSRRLGKTTMPRTIYIKKENKK
jgi:hypothetical protein|tara:strand:+ start:47 stop:220 length:174 start_codon:yes stop_codon:yes gene_type:complete